MTFHMENRLRAIAIPGSVGILLLNVGLLKLPNYYCLLNYRVLSNVEGKYLMDSVPFSCCNPGSPRPCIQHHLNNNTAHYDYDHHTEELNIWTRGCREALVSYYGGMMNSIGAFLFLVICLEAAVMVGLQYLSTSLESLANPEDPESESEGWLLEKSVKETVAEFTSKVKALCQRNQVEGEEQGVATVS